MKRIVLHWTGGLYRPNHVDLEHYHYLIDDKGAVYSGKYKPEENENCNDGRYAAHTGGGNTGSIGVSFCGMYNFSANSCIGDHPLTRRQLEAGFKLCAKLSKKYNIPVENIITHYEFGNLNPHTSSHGKIDIIYLPPFPHVKPNEIGGFIRDKIRWYLSKM